MNTIIRHEFPNTPNVYYNEQPMQAKCPDVDKTQPIGEMTKEELDSLIQRLYLEREAENLLADMQSSSEVDKSKSISEMTGRELDKLIQRLASERNAQDLIKNLNSNAGVKMYGSKRATLDTTTPINQLYHHGILGMKWGRRRFQNPDGTRTTAGKKRESDQRDDIPKSDDHKQAKSDRRKATKGLSNAELKRLNDRLQLEKTYKELSTAETKRGESMAKTVLKDITKTSLTTAGTKLATGILNSLITDKILNLLKNKAE
jgi:hypothetical protein